MFASNAGSLIWWDWVWEHTEDIQSATIDHLELTLWSVFGGFCIAMAMAMASLRWRSAYAPLASFSGILYSIPSLALFGLLVPITGLGYRTALIGLTSYTLLILLRNIVEGVDAVPEEVKEAADGMGFEPWRRFLSVDLRLATPTIIGGLRVATVTIIGLVTIGALVGSGGLGTFINDGLDRRFSTPIMVGGGLSIVLAVAFDMFFVALQWLITPWARRGVR